MQIRINIIDSEKYHESVLIGDNLINYENPKQGVFFV